MNFEIAFDEQEDEIIDIEKTSDVKNLTLIISLPEVNELPSTLDVFVPNLHLQFQIIQNINDSVEQLRN